MATICGANDMFPIPIRSINTYDFDPSTFRIEVAPEHMGMLNTGVEQAYRIAFDKGYSVRIVGSLEVSKNIQDGELKWILPGYLFRRAGEMVWTIPAEVAMRNA